MHTHTNMHACLRYQHAHIYARTHTSLHTHTHTPMQAHTHTHTHTQAPTCAHTSRIHIQTYSHPRCGNIFTAEDYLTKATDSRCVAKQEGTSCKQASGGINRCISTTSYNAGHNRTPEGRPPVRETAPASFECFIFKPLYFHTNNPLPENHWSFTTSWFLWWF